MLTKKIVLLFLLTAAFSVSLTCSPQSKEGQDPLLSRIKMPDGFSITDYATGIKGARSMALSPNGILYVGTRNLDKVYALVDTNNDYRSDITYVIAEGLFMPNGVAYHKGDLYVAEVNRVIKFRNIDATYKDKPKYEIVNNTFPSDRHHGWKFIAFGPDSMLYVPVGAPCNICLMEDERYASIMRMKPDGTGLEVFASGVRNTVGFDWHPSSGELWFTDNGRDRMGDDIPPDELNRAPVKGLHFGYPFLHGKDIKDPEFGDKKHNYVFTLPSRELGPHVAALGMRFYEGNMFPGEYKHQVFIAEHGSWNRSNKIGYRITLVRIKGNQAVSYETFAEGWLDGEKTLGRPVDILLLPDGSMLVSDDYADRIYRITFGNDQ